MKEKFVDKTFKDASLAIIESANDIITEYRAQGFSLTLRQLYYQFVARDLIANTQRSYKRLGAILSDARLAGLVDWSAIEDRTRNRAENPHWTSPESIIASAAWSYRRDKWADQPYRLECWIEKEALIGVIEQVCSELDIAWFACRGYVSQSEQWAAGKRFARYHRAGQNVVLLHLGDHDPSGIDMTRDNDERLSMFSRYGVENVERLALNFDQIEEYDPPPNPAKVTDSRYESYSAQYGTESWELDALDPTVLQALVRDAVLGYRDPDKWDAMVAREAGERKALQVVSDRWTKVEAFIEDVLEDEDD